MKREVYEELRSLLLRGHDQDDASQALQDAQAAFPQVPFDTLLSIQSQEQSRRLRLQFHKLRSPQSIQAYISRYVAGDDILTISSHYGIPPCLLARFLLEHLFGLTKQQITQCLKNPSSLPEDRINEISWSLQESTISAACESDQVLHPELHQKAREQAVSSLEATSCCSISWIRLYQDLHRCAESDSVTSPYVELIRRVTGVEFEALLYAKLQKLGIPFQTEDALRAAGFSKTPDVKLEVPIAVRGRLVNWIDSKASFGDEYNHKVQANQQFQRYVNRFGPGMVIYWFGFVDELDDQPDIVLLDAFPSKEEIYCLPILNVQPRP